MRQRAYLLKRLALSTRAGKVIGLSGRLMEIAFETLRHVPRHKTMAVRSKSHTLETELGAELFRFGYVMDLDEPDVKVVCYKIDNLYLAGIDTSLNRDFNARRPQFRPYFHPTSMHPKLARVLVNLARVRKGDLVLDPFCGTGGIMIETGMMGISVKGSDIDPNMVAGCKKNLEVYGVCAEVTQADALDLSGISEKADAIVTDPPYARSSYVSEKNLDSFYGKFLASAYKALKPGGHLVMMIPRQHIIDFGSYTLLSEFHVRVHKSLTRRVLVLRKPGGDIYSFRTN